MQEKVYDGLARSQSASEVALAYFTVKLHTHMSYIAVAAVRVNSTLSEYSLERSLALNYSHEVYIVSRRVLPPSMYRINNTHVVRMAVVANDPADFSRNSYAQRTLNDLLASHCHGNSRIDLLRLVAAHDRDVVQMWELVRYLVDDSVLLRVQQLHLLVYIGRREAIFADSPIIV